MKSVCWYASKAAFYSNSKTCIAKFSKAESEKFGWAAYYYDEVKDMYHNGRVCASGLAIPITYKSSSTNDT